MDGSMDGRKDGQMNGCMHKKDGGMGRWMDKDKWMDRWMYGWIAKHKGGMDEWKAERMDG